MKTFHWENGAVAAETMTVGELIEKLGQYAKDAPLFVDDQDGRPPRPLGISLTTQDIDYGVPAEHCTCVVIE